MKKEKIKLKDILEEEEEVKENKRKYGLVAEEIEEKDLENPSANKISENDEDFDEEEFEEEIEDFVPRTRQIQLESKIEGLFPKKEEEQAEEEKKDESEDMFNEQRQREDERQHGNPMEEMIKKLSGKKIEGPDFLKEGNRLTLDIGFRKGELRRMAQELEEGKEIKYSKKWIRGEHKEEVEGLRELGEEDFGYSSEETKSYESEKAESKAEAKESSSSEK